MSSAGDDSARIVLLIGERCCSWQLYRTAKDRAKEQRNKWRSSLTMAKDTIPHIPKLSADGRAQVAEGRCGLLACCAQALGGLFISVDDTQKLMSHFCLRNDMSKRRDYSTSLLRRAAQIYKDANGTSYRIRVIWFVLTS